MNHCGRGDEFQPITTMDKATSPCIAVHRPATSLNAILRSSTRLSIQEIFNHRRDSGRDLAIEAIG